MDNLTRRVFLARSVIASVSGAHLLTARLSATDLVLQEGSGRNLFDRMKWFNDPASAKVDGEQLIVVTRAKTDYWRKTYYGYITNNGHFYHMPFDGDFILQARVSGDYKALYDQAGLMVRVDDINWMKCGLELVDGIGHASVVVTRDFSDWSTVRGVSTKDPVWWKVVRKSDALEMFYSIDGKNYISIRQGYLPMPASVQVGLMCASPEGQGFECKFDEFRIQKAMPA